MNHLLCFICALTLQQGFATNAQLLAGDHISAPLVSVVLAPDFRPEAEFYIAEALRRPPLDWNMLQEQTQAEIPQTISQQQLTDEILTIWDALWKNNPLSGERTDTIAQHIRDLRTDLACSQALAQGSLASDIRPAHEFDLTQLPEIHTGEDLMAESTQPASTFPLDPYGYDEYNQYFEPEVYDWFVFITDDLSVVYVHELSDSGPAAPQVAESLDTPHFDLEVAATIAKELNAEKSVPEGFQVFVRERVRRIAAGEVTWHSVAEQVADQTRAISQPILDRYVRKGALLRSYRVADLSELLRFQ